MMRLKYIYVLVSVIGVLLGGVILIANKLPLKSPQLIVPSQSSQQTSTPQTDNTLNIIPSKKSRKKKYKRVKNFFLIAHAGGGIDNHFYTNSLEALNQSVKNGFRYIELDFLRTNNGDLVLLHDWDAVYSHFFNPSFIDNNDGTSKVSVKPETALEFKTLEMKYGLTNLTLQDLINWMSDNPDVYIVTDVRGGNVSILAKIAEMSGSLQSRFIPQIYNLEEYTQVKDLGFNDIILTIYRLKTPMEDLGDFCRENDLFALTIPKKQINKDTFKRLGQINTPVYTHTVNAPWPAWKFMKKGVTGFYTDFLYPGRP